MQAVERWGRNHWVGNLQCLRYYSSCIGVHCWPNRLCEAKVTLPRAIPPTPKTHCCASKRTDLVCLEVYTGRWNGQKSQPIIVKEYVMKASIIDELAFACPLYWIGDWNAPLLYMMISPSHCSSRWEITFATSCTSSHHTHTHTDTHPPHTPDTNRVLPSFPPRYGKMWKIDARR